MQRVVAGTHRGRKLLELPRAVTGVRPSSSRVRSAIFDRLQAEVVDAEVLDLFAGSGALAIEALSRGAKRAVLVEQQAALIRFLDEQLRRLGLRERCELIHDDARRYLERASPATGPQTRQPGAGRFDLVLIDPPYAEVDLYSTTLARLVAAGLLADGASVVLELPRHRGKLPALALPRELVVEAIRDHGQTALEFLRVTPPSEPSSQT